MGQNMVFDGCQSFGLHHTLRDLHQSHKFDPDHLLGRYKKAGAKYFCSMAVHHDGFDLWDSKYQPRWNAVATGPLDGNPGTMCRRAG